MPAAIPVTVFGVTYRSRLQACKAFSQNPGKIDHRLRRGISLEKALTMRDHKTDAKKHPSYSHWNGMRSRCLSKSACSKRYKGKVDICERWKNDFWAFVEDMGVPPGQNYTVERKDNSKGYDKNNCIWATMAQQARNRKTNVFIECFGKRMILKDWADETGIHPDVISYRIKNGVSPEVALTDKPQKGRTLRVLKLMNIGN